LATLPGYRGRRRLWGAERTVVLFLSAPRRRGHIRGLHQPRTKRREALQQWQQTLAKPRSGPRTPAGAQKQIAALLTGQDIPPVLKIAYDGQRTGVQRFAWWIDQVAREHLEPDVFGTRMLMTDQPDWSTEEIIRAYRGQRHAEAVFRQLKEVDHLAVRPPSQWPDPTIRGQTFIGLLALLLCRLMARESRGLGYQGRLSSLLALLRSIRLAMVLWPAATPNGPPRGGWVLEESAPAAWNLYPRFVPPQPPFV
jgi:hypothetical protein